VHAPRTFVAELVDAWFACVIFRQQNVQHCAERLCSLLWKRLKIPRSDFCEVLLFAIPNHPVAHWVKKSFKSLKRGHLLPLIVSIEGNVAFNEVPF